MLISSVKLPDFHSKWQIDLLPRWVNGVDSNAVDSIELTTKKPRRVYFGVASGFEVNLLIGNQLMEKSSKIGATSKDFRFPIRLAWFKWLFKVAHLKSIPKKPVHCKRVHRRHQPVWQPADIYAVHQPILTVPFTVSFRSFDDPHQSLVLFCPCWPTFQLKWTTPVLNLPLIRLQKPLVRGASGKESLSSVTTIWWRDL